MLRKWLRVQVLITGNVKISRNLVVIYGVIPLLYILKMCISDLFGYRVGWFLPEKTIPNSYTLIQILLITRHQTDITKTDQNHVLVTIGVFYSTTLEGGDKRLSLKILISITR